jgi:hypothetical protein
LNDLITRFGKLQSVLLREAVDDLLTNYATANRRREGYRIAESWPR